MRIASAEHQQQSAVEGSISVVQTTPLLEPTFTACAGEFSEDEEQAELAEQMNAQASSQPASHTVYTVHPETDVSAPGASDREGPAESDLPADSEGWEDGSVPADSGGEAAAEPEQPADPEGWDDDFPLDNVDVAQVGACAACSVRCC